MELYIEPEWAKKDTKFKKGSVPWNKGIKGFTTSDDGKRKKMLECLLRGRMKTWQKRDRNTVYNQKATCVYDLEGRFLGVYVSATKAANAYGQEPRNVRYCISGKRKRVGAYMFRKAEIVDFKGEKLVKKSPIEPYRRGQHK